MKYKNVTNGTLRFRAFDVNGVKKAFELKAGEEEEFGGSGIAPGHGLELVGQTRRVKGGD